MKNKFDDMTLQEQALMAEIDGILMKEAGMADFFKAGLPYAQKFGKAALNWGKNTAKDALKYTTTNYAVPAVKSVGKNIVDPAIKTAIRNPKTALALGGAAYAYNKKDDIGNWMSDKKKGWDDFWNSNVSDEPPTPTTGGADAGGAGGNTPSPASNTADSGDVAQQNVPDNSVDSENTPDNSEIIARIHQLFTDLNDDNSPETQELYAEFVRLVPHGAGAILSPSDNTSDSNQDSPAMGAGEMVGKRIKDVGQGAVNFGKGVWNGLTKEDAEFESVLRNAGMNK
jgi:hypothetical protein